MHIHRFRLLYLSITLLLLTFASSSRSHAQGGCVTGSPSCASAPELDGALAGSSAALLGAAVLAIRSRRKK